jgi:hypothetical protein
MAQAIKSRWAFVGFLHPRLVTDANERSAAGQPAYVAPVIEVQREAISRTVKTDFAPREYGPPEVLHDRR